MNRRLRTLIFWVSLVGGAGVMHWFFVTVITMPVASVVTLSLLITWLVPRPILALTGLAIVAELLAITPPLSMTAALFSPLLIFWLRGRISADISFSYTILIAASAALSLTILAALGTYPYAMSLPWPRILMAWAACTTIATSLTLLLPSLMSKYLHDRYH
jgi:hypothetical protein